MFPLTRQSLPRPASAGLALVSGLLIGLGFAPMGIWPATIVGVGLFTWLMAGRRLRAAAGLGLLAGLAMNAVTIHWIGVLGTGVAIGLIGFMSLWFALLGVVVALLCRLSAWWVLVPCAWVATELLAGRFPFGGFPWTRLAYTAVDQPISGWLPWVGATGATFLVALVAHLGLWAIVDRTWRRRAMVGAAVILVVGAVLPLVPQASPEQSVTVGLVQGNNNRWEKGTGSYARSVTNNHLSETILLMAANRASGAAPIDFVLWPENATDVDPILDAQTRRSVEAAAAIAGVPIFVGAVMEGPQPDTRQTTGLWWTPDGGPVDRYDKRNLVPFGEWIPFRDFLLPRLPVLKQIGKQSIPGTKPGVLTAPTASYQHLRVGDIICFELAWDETVYDTVRHGADVVVSQSNTNTYGATFEVPQQLVINRVRAIELGREIIASTLNSTSALVDARGGVHEVTAEFTAAHRTFVLPLRSNINLAVLLSPWLGYLGLLATLAGVALALRRRGEGRIGDRPRPIGSSSMITSPHLNRPDPRDV